MGRKKLLRTLKVYLAENFVGELTRQPSGAIEFRYCDEWVSQGHAISLSLPLVEKVFRGSRVANYFENLLPDNRGVLEAIAQKFHAESTKQFDLLSAVGKDCVGALTFFGAEEAVDFQQKMKLRQLSDGAIAGKIRGLAFDTPLGMEGGDFRISLAGAQEKMALLRWKEKWWEPQGQTPTSHILKKKLGTILGGVDFSSSVDNEWICLRLARAVGIDACDATIESFEDERVLCVRRFDRVWKEGVIHRIAQEDFCQAHGVSPQQKYERDGGVSFRDAMRLLETSNNADRDRRMLLKLAVLNDLLHNTDGHGKNISLYLTRRGVALTPAYDLLSAHFLRRKHPERYASLRSSWSVNGKFEFTHISLADWSKEARAAGMSQAIFDDCWSELRTSLQLVDPAGWDLPPDLDRELLAAIVEGVNERMRKLG